MNNRPVRQHYIPAFFLRNFTKSKNNKTKLFVFDKNFNKSHCSAINDINVKNRRYSKYSLPDENNDIYAAERKFSDIEGFMSTTYNKNITAYTINCLSLLFCKNEKMMDSIIKKFILENSNPYERIENIESNIYKLYDLIVPKSSFNIINKYTNIIYLETKSLNHKVEELFLSDNPCCEIDLTMQSDYLNFAHKLKFVYLPISIDKVAILFNKKDRHIINIFTKRIGLNNDNLINLLIRTLNAISIITADNYIYTKNDMSLQGNFDYKNFVKSFSFGGNVFCGKLVDFNADIRKNINLSFSVKEYNILKDFNNILK